VGVCGDWGAARKSRPTHALQHRGQESAASSRDASGEFRAEKGIGLSPTSTTTPRAPLGNPRDRAQPLLDQRQPHAREHPAAARGVPRRTARPGPQRQPGQRARAARGARGLGLDLPDHARHRDLPLDSPCRRGDRFEPGRVRAIRWTRATPCCPARPDGVRRCASAIATATSSPARPRAGPGRRLPPRSRARELVRSTRAA
jgi:hypothetical protein